jgi:hypothetical protein
LKTGRVSMEDKGKNVSAPAIAIAIWITGSLMVLIGAITTAGSISEREGAATGFGIFVSGIVLIGFGSVIDRLHRIDLHLHSPLQTTAPAPALKPDLSNPPADIAGTWNGEPVMTPAPAWKPRDAPLQFAGRPLADDDHPTTVR